MKRGFALIGFSAAVTLLVLNMVSVSLALVISAGIAVLFIASLLLSEFRKAMVVPICFGSALFACLMFLSVYYSAVQPALLLDKSTAASSFYITNCSKNSDGTFIYTAKVVNILKNGAPQGIKIRIKTDSEIYADAYQLINGNLKFYAIGAKSFSSFGYWGKGIYLSSQLQNYEVTDTIVNKFMLYLYNLRQDIAQVLFENIKGDAGAVAVALITGDKTRLSDKAYFDFRSAGVSHLMSVSGLHLSIITGAVYFILSKLRINGKLVSFLLITMIIIYSALIGFPISVVRAGIMLCVLLSGQLFKLRADTLNSLGFAVFIICLNPFAVCDVGAVLSVLSVLALICSDKVFSAVDEKIISLRFTKIRRFDYTLKEALKYLFDSVFASALVLAFNLPALYIFFGYFSIFAVVLNVVIIPLGSFSTILSFLTYFSNRLGFMPEMFNAVERLVNTAILNLVALSSKFDFSIIRTGRYFGVILGGIIFLFSLSFLFNNKAFRKAVAYLAAAAITLTSVMTYYENRKTAELFIVDNDTFAVASNGEAFVFGVDNNSDYKSVSSYLSVRDVKINTLITSFKGSEYACRLSEKIGCKTIVSYVFSSRILKNAKCESYIVKDKYEGTSGKDISYKFDLRDNADYLNLKIRDTAFCISNNTENKNAIYIASKRIYDYNGIIDLNNGEILYTIYDNNIYEARRLNIWES